MTISSSGKDRAVNKLLSLESGINYREVQTELFPLRTLIEKPDSTGTADAWGKVEAVDTHIYIVKDDRSGLNTRAAEWICTHLAELTLLPCPTPKIIQIESGELLFGSREIAGIADKTITAEILTSVTANSRYTRIPGLQSVLSALYALDMFVNNDDRHDENYISVDNAGTRRFYAIDFSRALPFENFMAGFISSRCHTRSTGARIRERHGFDLAAASSMVDRILALAPDLLMGIIVRMPDDWLSQERRSQLLSWWSGEGRRARLEDLRKGLTDGTLL